MKHLLLITDIFPPDFAPRMGYLCSHFPDDWQITVYAERVRDEHFSFPVPPQVDVHRIAYYHQAASWLAKAEYVFKHVLNLLFSYKDRYFWRQTKQDILRQRYDAVLCSTYYTFPLPFALRAAKALGVPLVADLRDIKEQYPQPERLWDHVRLWGKGRRINARRRNRVLRSAHALTTVSPWHVSVLQQYNPQVRLIYNGFDDALFVPENVPAPTFNIVYTGRLWHTGVYQDPQLLVQALRELQAEQPALFADLRLHWYTDEESERSLQPYDMAEFAPQTVQFHGLVPAAAIPDILRSASIVLVLANKTTAKGPHGIMTTKFFEALGVEKPVLCVRSDEACLAETIRDTNAGLAATTVAEVKEFIMEKYAEWRANGFTRQPVNLAAKAQFSRSYQARQFAEELDRL